MKLGFILLLTVTLARADQKLELLVNNYFEALRKGEKGNYEVCYLSKKDIANRYKWVLGSADQLEKNYQKYLLEMKQDAFAILQEANKNILEKNNVNLIEIYAIKFDVDGEIVVMNENEILTSNYIPALLITYSHRNKDFRISQSAFITSSVIKINENWKFIEKFRMLYLKNHRFIYALAHKSKVKNGMNRAHR